MSNLYQESLTLEEIVFEGAMLIDTFFGGCDANVLAWCPNGPGWAGAEDTSLVYGDLFFDERGQPGSFRTLVRHFLQQADLAELSYVEYDCGHGDPIWVMLVKGGSAVDLAVGTYVCHRASHSWTIRQLLLRSQYRKRQLDAVLKLLVPNYPDCDHSCRLDQLILPVVAESDTRRQSASQRSSNMGGRCDD